MKDFLKRKNKSIRRKIEQKSKDYKKNMVELMRKGKAMNKELNSCPFCGSISVELTDDENKTRCESCGAEGPKFHLFDGKSRIKAWNIRYNDRELVEALESVLKAFEFSGWSIDDERWSSSLRKATQALAKVK